MSSGSEQSPKPSKKRRVVISDSDSSDGSIVRTHRRRRVYRVTSDVDSSDEESDVQKPVSKRKNYRLVSEDDTSYESSDTDADWQDEPVGESNSDSSGSESEWRSTDEDGLDEDSDRAAIDRKPKALLKGETKSKSKVNKEEEQPAIESDSDSSDAQAEKCPICLLSFRKQEVATPETCDHSFCLDCLIEWSKNINTCPVDRKTFTMILARNKLGGKVTKQLPVTVRPSIEDQIQEDPTYCEVCAQCDREDRMLLCDGCDLGYHLECLTPPITEVPMDEWFCPECAQNSQNDAEMVEIDLDELPDLMEEARRLGESYGRTRTGRDRESMINYPRVIARTRQTERVRANIWADRDRTRNIDRSGSGEHRSAPSYFDPDQPSTSTSGIDSLGENSRSWSRDSVTFNGIVGAVAATVGSTRRRRAAVPAVQSTGRKRKSKKRRASRKSGPGPTVIRKVTITEINDDGEQEEFTTYVKVTDRSAAGKRTGKRKYRKKKSKNTRKKRSRPRRARTVHSLANKVQTVKKRLARVLGIKKQEHKDPLLIPAVKIRQTVSDRSQLSSTRHNAGISQVSLFGNSHDLNYSPTGSDEESDSCTVGNGLLVSSRPRNAISSTRRHAALKMIRDPLAREESASDIIGSILNSQEFWHSKKNDITLKADGTFLVKNNNNNKGENDRHSINNNNSPIKKKNSTNDEESVIATKETPLDLSNVGQNDIVQNPMYNGPRGSGNRGNFRGGGGYNCENNRHSYGGQGYGGGRDSYGGGGGGGRHSYGGPGGPRDNYNSGRDFGPPINYNQGFEGRASQGFPGNPPFRNRNPQQNFRNERPRFPLPPDRNEQQQQQQRQHQQHLHQQQQAPPFCHRDNNGERPPPPAFSHANTFQRFRAHHPPLVPGPIPGIPRGPGIRHGLIQNSLRMGRDSMPGFHLHEDVREQPAFQNAGVSNSGTAPVFGPRNQADDEECDLYSDIEAPVSKVGCANDSPVVDDGSSGVLLPPPPEPPSGLLDFEESKSDRDCNDSDQELVIDDTPREDNRERRNDDKYDPFADDSDSNDSLKQGKHGHVKDGDKAAQGPSNQVHGITHPVAPYEQNFHHELDVDKPTPRLTAYDDDEDEDSQADCPNFSIYSSQSMDVARNSEQELSQQIGPLEPPPLPPDIPDDDDIIVGDVQACDLSDIPEPSDPYVESLQKERRQLSKIPPKKISNDSRGKITFKIGNKLRLSNKLSNLYDEMDEDIENSIQQEKESEEKKHNRYSNVMGKPVPKDAAQTEEIPADLQIRKTDGNNEKEEDKKKDKEGGKAPESEAIDKSDEDDEEKLEELEKELKEKEQKLREMEQQEEIEKKNAEESTHEEVVREIVKKKDEKAKGERVDCDEDDDDVRKTGESHSTLGVQEKVTTREQSLTMSTIDLTEKSSDTIISIADSIHSSPKNATFNDQEIISEENLDSSPGNEVANVQGDRDKPVSLSSGWKTVENGQEAVSNVSRELVKDTQALYDQIDQDFISGHIKDGEAKEEEASARVGVEDEEGDDGDVQEREDEQETYGGEEDEDEDEEDYQKTSKKSRKRSDKVVKDDSRLSKSEENLEKALGTSGIVDFLNDGENFPLEKDTTDLFETTGNDSLPATNWESDGAYTPCKDELPVKGGKDVRRGSLSPFESGLEPITPTKDRSNDDLDGCRTPAGYAGLGTEAISETEEPMSFEDEGMQLSLRREKEIEDGEIMDDARLTGKVSDKPSKEKEEENKKKKKKEKKEKGKESDKNKENISSENQVAWKKISKSTKERQYRDKDRRSKSKDKEKDKDKESQKDKERDRDRDREKDKTNKDSKDKDRSKKKGREVTRKKEKRKELERYDVRKIVADKPVHPRKDEYGRDIRDGSRSRSRSRTPSRRRSLSRDRRSQSYSRNRSRSRSRSRPRRSWSRDRRSYSKGGRSLSRGRRSLSRSRRKISRKRSASRKRSVSRKRSMSRKRSLSKRRSWSQSRKRRSPMSPRRRSRGRSLSKNRRSSSRSREKKREKLKKHKSRSRSKDRKRSRSKTPKRISSRSRDKKHAKRKHNSRSRERSKSREPRDRNKTNWEPINEKGAVDRERHASSRERRSWSAQWTPSWSRSRSRTPTSVRHEEVASRSSWSPVPVLDNVAVPPKNLTVILTNKEAIKKKKKEKKREPKKGAKDIEKRKRNKRNRTPPPSKEVFASGDNILVSVCFNKENETNPIEMANVPEATPLVTPAAKRRRRETVQSEPTIKRSKKEKLKEKRAPKSPKNKKERKKKSKAAEIAATKKPVAVIDLDQSPFREQTPSPHDVIVLSDDEDKQVQEMATPEQHVSPRPTPQHEQFVSQGPKTPPEPQIKFSINKQQSNLRTSMINPLHEEEEEEEREGGEDEEEEEEEEVDERVDEELEMRAQEELELRLKIGPNTPPEPPTSPPTSPDAYDPFDPTKSRSPTPAASQEATPADDRDRNHHQCNSPRNPHDASEPPSCPPSEPDKQMLQDQQINQDIGKQNDKPKIISMVTIKRASPKRDSPPISDGQTDTNQSTDTAAKNQQGLQVQHQQNNPTNFTNVNPVLATVTAAVQRSTMFNAGAPSGGQRNLTQPNRISPINQNKQRSSNDRPQLTPIFANPTKLAPAMRGVKSTSSSSQNKNASAMGQNGSDATLESANDTLDMSSPYSPGSSLSDGIFDPPSPGGHSPQQLLPPPTNTNKNTPSKTSSGKTVDKKDAFDTLFGSSPAVKNLGKARARKVPEKDKKKKSTNPKVGVRMDENQLQILDDLPSSAVEMQVKDKFLKKLNRQERVVEEVKLVLKPHYTKKHVTKDEYKDIMRKAVPKICHNKTGEINPKKIGQLVEAYVKKCRINKKKGSGGPSNTTKATKPAKNLWS